MMILLLTSCYLYTGDCRVEAVHSTPLTSEECVKRAQILARTLARSIGDDGWTPVGVICTISQGAGS